MPRNISVTLHDAYVVDDVGNIVGSVTASFETSTEDENQINLDLRIATPDTLEAKVSNIVIPWGQLVDASHYIIEFADILSADRPPDPTDPEVGERP